MEYDFILNFFQRFDFCGICFEFFFGFLILKIGCNYYMLWYKVKKGMVYFLVKKLKCLFGLSI